MFSFFKRKTKAQASAPTEADFDIMPNVEILHAIMEKDEIVRLFLDWTQNPGTMTELRLANLIMDQSDTFSKKYGHERLADQSLYAKLFAGKLIPVFMDMGLMEKSREKGGPDFNISMRGEQIRQFYVLKKGLGGTIYDRMDLFAKA